VFLVLNVTLQVSLLMLGWRSRC